MGFPIRLLMVALLATGLATTPSVADEPMVVFTSVGPLASLVRQIGMSRVTTEVLVRPGQDPHTFEPTPQQMATLGRARLFFTVGMPFETVLLQRMNTNGGRLRIVDSTHGIRKRGISPCEGDCDHSDDQPHEGELPAADPHVWLSPTALKTLAANIADTLEKADPAHAAEYRQNLEALLKRVDARDARIRSLLAPFRGRTIYVYHPSLGYFCDAYGLKQKAVETGGKSPTPKQLRALIQQARADGVKAIFVQRQFDPRGAKVVAESIGGGVVPIDPLAEDVLENLETMARSIAEAMRK